MDRHRKRGLGGGMRSNSEKSTMLGSFLYLTYRDMENQYAASKAECIYTPTMFSFVIGDYASIVQHNTAPLIATLIRPRNSSFKLVVR